MRNIRLAEYTPGLDRSFWVDDDYMKGVVRGLLYQKDYPVRVNSTGFIADEEIAVDKQTRVLLGDSIVECLFMEPKERIHSRLSILNPSVVYLNHGVSNMTSLDLLNVVTNKLIPLGISEVFIMPGPADLLGILNSPQRAFGTTLVNQLTAPNILSEREIFLEAAISILTQFGVKVLMATFAHRGDINDPYHMLLAKRNPLELELELNNVTRRIAKKFSLTLIDFEQIMANNYSYMYDRYHLTTSGAELVAYTLQNYGF